MARRELDLYAKALDNFHADFARYPNATEGLAALVRQPSTLAGWRGPYIEKDYSVDPWAPITSIRSSMTGRVIFFPPMVRREKRLGAPFCKSLRERPGKSKIEDRR
jgi:hypothetical protein